MPNKGRSFVDYLEAGGFGLDLGGESGLALRLGAGDGGVVLGFRVCGAADGFVIARKNDLQIYCFRIGDYPRLENILRRRRARNVGGRRVQLEKITVGRRVGRIDFDGCEII